MRVINRAPFSALRQFIRVSMGTLDFWQGHEAHGPYGQYIVS